jgi:hypothetical protein
LIIDDEEDNPELSKHISLPVALNNINPQNHVFNSA